MNKRNLLVCALGLLVADVIAWVFAYSIATHDQIRPIIVLSLIGLWVVRFLVLRRQYFKRVPFWTELEGLFNGVCAFMALAILAEMLLGEPLQFFTYVQWGGLLFVSLVIGRGVARKVLRWMDVWARPAVILGSGKNAIQLYQALKNFGSLGYKVHAVVVPDAADEGLPIDVPRWSWPSTSQDFERLQDYKCMIALEANQSDLLDMLLRELSLRNVKRVSVVPAMRGVPMFGLEATQFFSHEVLMLHVRNQLAKPSLRVLKRVFDIVGSSVLLVLMSPVFAYVAYKVSRDGGNVFFGHERVGQGGRKFKCYKFRSMIVNAQEVLKDLLERDPVARAEWEQDFKLKNDPRINPIGHFLRRTSLDELPQLWNVFKGEMSLVGPRPVVYTELERYGHDVVYYLQAKPGMTGLWQVSGRNDVDYKTRVYFDSWYVKNWSVWADIAILFKTISVVSGRNGAY